jgi:Cu/Ag efflux protein CusF
LDHEEIPGFMKAMTMWFRVEDTKILEDFHMGDKVVGKLRVYESKKYVITELKRVDN